MTCFRNLRQAAFSRGAQAGTKAYCIGFDFAGISFVILDVVDLLNTVRACSATFVGLTISDEQNSTLSLANGVILQRCHQVRLCGIKGSIVTRTTTCSSIFEKLNQLGWIFVDRGCKLGIGFKEDQSEADLSVCIVKTWRSTVVLRYLHQCTYCNIPASHATSIEACVHIVLTLHLRSALVTRVVGHGLCLHVSCTVCSRLTLYSSINKTTVTEPHTT